MSVDEWRFRSLIQKGGRVIALRLHFLGSETGVHRAVALGPGNIMAARLDASM